MKTSNFYRLYVDGYRKNVLINADNMVDALRVASMYIDDETIYNVRVVRSHETSIEVVYAHEKSINLEEIRKCDILTLGKGGADDE